MLTLPIKKKWFDMIISGEKNEEYRDNTPYWGARLNKFVGSPPQMIRLRNGYRKDSPAVIILASVDFRYGRKEWGGDPYTPCFVLTIEHIFGTEFCYSKIV